MVMQIQTLVVIEHEKGRLLRSGLAALSAAKAAAQASGLQGVGVVLFGSGAREAAVEAGTLPVDRVLFSEDPILTPFLPGIHGHALAQLAQREQATLIVGASTAAGKDMFPCAAGLLNAGQASDIVAVTPDGAFVRPIFAGDLLAEVEISTPVRIVTVRASAFAPISGGGAAPVASEEVACTVSGVQAGEVIEVQRSAAGRPQLSDAKVVVSGGRALKSKEEFERLMFPLADALGAAVGASRAAVDSGYAPNDWQVGQTGKVVAPDLYIAVGISGAVQHQAGMKGSKVIVAINKDSEAPIFEIADYGLQADLFEVVPELTKLVSRSS